MPPSGFAEPDWSHCGNHPALQPNGRGATGHHHCWSASDRARRCSRTRCDSCTFVHVYEAEIGYEDETSTHPLRVSHCAVGCPPSVLRGEVKSAMLLHFRRYLMRGRGGPNHVGEGDGRDQQHPPRNREPKDVPRFHARSTASSENCCSGYAELQRNFLVAE